MPRRLAGKVAFITGAACGQGRRWGSAHVNQSRPGHAVGTGRRCGEYGALGYSKMITDTP
jgi:hypothetical protein